MCVWSVGRMDKWEKPYKGKNKTTKYMHRGKTGVYVLRCKVTKDILYVGMGSCVYKAFYRHFHKWKDSESRVHFNKTNTECRFILTTKEDVHKVEVRLIRYYKPKLNSILYESSVIDSWLEKIDEVPF